jgi:hypothetical protein
LEREREEAIARNKDKERQKKLGSSFDIVGPDGVKYVYDNRGFKVTEEQYQRQLDEAEREKKRLSHEKIVEPHGVELIEKTRRFVEELRKRVEMVRRPAANLHLEPIINTHHLSGNRNVGDGH